MRMKSKMKQWAVYWGAPQPDGRGGSTFAEPIEIKVRWQRKQELFLDTDGREQISHASVYAYQDMQCGGYLFEGKIVDFDSAADTDNPMTVTDAFMIRNFGSSTNVKGSQMLRKIWL